MMQKMHYPNYVWDDVIGEYFATVINLKYI